MNSCYRSSQFYSIATDGSKLVKYNLWIQGRTGLAKANRYVEGALMRYAIITWKTRLAISNIRKISGSKSLIIFCDKFFADKHV